MDSREAPNQILKYRKSANAPNYKKSPKNIVISTIGFQKKVQQCRDGDTRKGLCGICCWGSGKKSRILAARTSIFLAKAFHTNREDQFFLLQDLFLGGTNANVQKIKLTGWSTI